MRDGVAEESWWHTLRDLERLQRSDADIDVVIRRYIDPSSTELDPSRAKLRDYGVSVWVLIADVDPAEGNLAEVACDYEIPPEAIEAAIYFYQRHREAIDARIALHAAAFAS